MGQHEPQLHNSDDQFAEGVALGDLMRGERATLGKSLLDVERELKIRATYIAAVENGDLNAFSSQGFIAGYVRSYARYLNLDPELAFAKFCEETGFTGVHGMSSGQASRAKRRHGAAPSKIDPSDIINSSRVAFAPEKERVFANVEPGALGSAAVLIALAVGLGYGGWAVLTDIQRVQFAPIDEAPATLAVLDPLALPQAPAAEQGGDFGFAEFAAAPSVDALDRLYRPQVLDAPVMISRDQPIASLNPDEVGTMGAPIPLGQGEQLASANSEPVQVTERPEGEVMLFAVRPSWVRVAAASGTVIYEGILNTGDSYVLPVSEEPPSLRAGNSGSLFFAVDGVTVGPAGEGTSVARNVVLQADTLLETYALADGTTDPDLPEVAALVLSGDSPSDTQQQQ